MWRISFYFSLLAIYTFTNVENKSLVIPLVRHKSPREIGLNPNGGIGQNIGLLKPPHNRTNDSIALYRFLDSEFYGLIQVGKPGRPFNVLFSTTWGDSYLYSKDCNYRKIGCWFHNKYDHEKSSTYVENGTNFFMRMGNVNLTGYYSKDTFSIAHLRADNQTFVEITDLPNYYILSKADGLMGMGFPSFGISTPFFYNLLEQNKLKNRLFSVYLNRDRSSSHGGNIILGAIQNKHIHVTNKVYDKITYLPVNTKNGYWEYKQDRIILYKGLKKIEFCKSGCNAIADISINIIGGPKSEVESINKLIGGTLLFMDRYQVNCDSIHHLPHISFVLNGKVFNITGPQYIQKVSYEFVTLCLSAFVPEESFVESDMWLIGGPFLTVYYSIYNFATEQIGFVKAA